MTSKGPIDCVFYLESSAIAKMPLHALPLEGEIVMLRKYAAPQIQPAPFVVKGRIFQTEGAAHNRQIVYIYVTEMDAKGLLI